MSRLANTPITIPDAVKVTVDLDGDQQVVNISNGQVQEQWRPHAAVKVRVEETQLMFEMSEKDRSDKFSRSMLGTDYCHIKNYIAGMVKPFETILEIHGLGYRVRQNGQKLVLTLGKSHDDEVEIPALVKVSVPNEREIVCHSHSKKILGDFVAEVCSKRRPDAYKAKGVRIRGRHYRVKKD